MQRTIAIALLLTVPGWASATPSAVFGKWTMDAQTPVISYTLVLDIEASAVSATVTCTVKGQSGSVTAHAAATVTDTQIIYTGSDIEQTEVAGVSCVASIPALTMGYTVNGTVLNVSQGQATFQLTRVQ